MTATYEKVQSTTLSSTQSTVTFSSISGAYTDLVLVMGGSNSANSDLRMRFNGDTGSNYSVTVLFGDGSAANSFRYFVLVESIVCSSRNVSRKASPI